MGLGLWGLGFGVWGLGFGVWGLGFGVWGLGFGVWGLGFGVWGLGLQVYKQYLHCGLKSVKNTYFGLFGALRLKEPQTNSNLLFSDLVGFVGHFETLMFLKKHEQGKNNFYSKMR